MPKKLTKKEWTIILQLAREALGGQDPEDWDYFYELVAKATDEIKAMLREKG
jgi:hypothetical protein